MINHANARAKLAEIARRAVGERVTVYPNGLDALAAFPAVVVGQPRWTPDQAGPCIDQSTFPLAVVMSRPGGNDTHATATLDLLWELVAGELGKAIDTDQTLGGVCSVSSVVRSDFGLFNIQGQDYPAQTIFIDLFG